MLKKKRKKETFQVKAKYWAKAFRGWVAFI